MARTVVRIAPFFPTAGFDVVALAASRGGLRALTTILEALPSSFPAAIVLVQHLSPHHHSGLAEVLNRRTALRVVQAQQDDHLRPGTVYAAPPDRHVLVDGRGRLSLSDAAKVHFTRPAADPLFASVATRFRARAIAVVLTGGDGDGALGAQLIKDAGGIVIAQNPATAEDFSMPATAIETGHVDYILPLPEIATMLLTLVWDGTGS